MRKLSNYDKGFIAALIDTDGCISLHKAPKHIHRGWSPQITVIIASNSIPFLNEIQRILGTNLKPILKKGLGHNYKISFRHNVIRWLLPQLKLIIKEHRRKQAIKIMAHLTNWTPRGKRILHHNSSYEKKLIRLCNEWK